MYITVYNDLGAITSIVNLMDDIYDTVLETLPQHILGNYSSEYYYVKEGTPLPKEQPLITYSNSTLYNVPVPAIITIDGTSYNTDDSVVELVIESPGTHTIKVKAFPYLDWFLEVLI
jgi:hypothetical protein